MAAVIRPKLTAPGGARPEVEHPALMEALIQATEQLLAEHGPEGISAIRIAARAGVSLGVLFQCFRNKDTIVAQAMERRRRAEAQRSPAASPAASPTASTKPRARAPAASRVAPTPTPTRTPPPPPASTLFRTPPSPPASTPARTPPAPPPASTLFRAPASSPTPDAAPRPAISRLPQEPAPAPRPAPVAGPARAVRPAPVPRPAPQPPPAPRETLEDGITSVVRPLLATFAALMPTLPSMPQADRDAINRVELKRMAVASEAMLANHQVPDPPRVAHVMTLSCDKVIKDAMRHAPESFTDGRLEQALLRLCLDFVRE